MLNVGSLFSGIGGLDEGLRRAGHRHVFFCESDAYRRDVLRARFPGVPVYEDVCAVARGGTERRGSDSEPGRGGTDAAASTELRSVRGGEPDPPERTPTIDLLCGGFPCQDLSVAGRRAGLAGDRSGLFFEFARIIESLRPSWLLIENVPGLLSSNGGRDFGVVLGTLADLGYGVAWRILDSRFFGVPQRRRRVFIVGAFADGDPRAAAERAGEVLAVGQGCLRHLAPRGEARPNVASPLGGSVGKGRGHDGNPFDRGGHSSLSGLGSGGPDDNDAQAGRLVVANTLKSQDGRGWSHDAEATYVADTVRSHPRPGSNSDGLLVAGPLDTRQTPQGHGMAGVNDQAVANNHVVAAPLTKGSATGEGVNAPGRPQEDDVNLVVAPPLVSRSSRGNAQGNSPGHNADAVVTTFTMRGRDGEATPEAQTDGLHPALRSGRGGGRRDSGVGGPDIGVRRLTPTECERLQGFPDGWTYLDDTADSRRYSALGDAVTVNVSEWIGRRLA